MKNISFCIATGLNELDYLKLLLSSLEENLANKNNEIIIFVDSDNQGTYEWLKNEYRSNLTDISVIKNTLEVPVTYHTNIDIMFEKSKYDIVSVLHSDMVIGKNYDINILSHLINDNIVVSGTRVEPPLHPPGNEKHIKDCGFTADKFKKETFNEFVRIESNSKKETYDWFAPFTMYKHKWLDIGGQDSLFRRSREDSDVLMRMRLNGLIFIQAWDALVYHFTCVSSRGIEWFKEENRDKTNLQHKADAVETRRFIRKWGKLIHNPTPIKENEQIFKYNVSLIVNNCKNIEQHLNLIFNINFYFNKIYLNDNNLISKLINICEDEHIYANTLSAYTIDNWNKYKKYLNTTNYYDIFKFNLSEYTDDILVEIDIENLDERHYKILQTLQDVIHYKLENNNVYQYEKFKITINNKNNVVYDYINSNKPKFNVEFIKERINK